MKDERQILTFEDLRDKAVRLLARRDHSTRELKVKLRRRGQFDDETFKRVLEFLREMKYLADENDLAARWITQWRSEGRGRRWIQGKLRTKGLVVPDLADDEAEIQAAHAFLDKKLRGKSLSSLSFQEKSRAARSLVSRGFSTLTVATLIGRKTKAKT